jgi:hypothetical protein
MSDPGRIRASDADREQVAEALREHFAAGRLSEDELSDRIDAVYKSATAPELDRVQAELQHRGHRRGHRGGRHSRRRELP